MNCSMPVHLSVQVGLDRLCSKLCLFCFSFMLKEWPYYASKSAYYACQVGDYATKYVAENINFQ